MTPQQRIEQALRAIEKREKNATAEKWFSEPVTGEMYRVMKSDSRELISDWVSPENSFFIAHSRTDIPRLRKALEVALKAVNNVDSPDYEDHILMLIADILDAP